MAVIDAEDALPRTLGDLWDLPPEAQALARHALALEDELEREQALRYAAEERVGGVEDATHSLRRAQDALADAAGFLAPSP